MPKRRHSRSREEDINYYKNKIRKLERKIQNRICDSEDVSEADDVGETFAEPFNEDIDAATPSLRPDDWLLQWPEDREVSNKTPEPQPGPSSAPVENPEPQPGPSSAPVGEDPVDLDTDVLAILGEESAITDKRGPDIRKELANRLLHIAKEGLSKDSRKELLSKYPVPANCVEIDAPKINPEIKAAITEAMSKRDMGIEHKQKQMTCAISCLAEIIDSQLISKTKDNDLIKKLMDANKILCDLQHADSITRKNFVLFSLKNDMKEHLKNTKIDAFLFGENLSETLKSAKAVNKSGVELKSDSNNKPTTTFKGPPTRPLNRRAPPQARRPPVGQALQAAPRSRGSAATRAHYHPSRQQHHHPQHAHSSKTSSQAQHGTYYPRRRY